LELPGKNLEQIADAYGVPVRNAGPETLGGELSWALDQPGPAVVVLRQLIVAAQATP
jgi:thiamine pyrophosphate-dependent acetolactate synthase large subunit-like protein